jgi:hypothetical protein
MATTDIVISGVRFPILSNGNLHVKAQSQWNVVYKYMVEKNLFRQAFSRNPDHGDTFGAFHFQDLRSLTSYFARFCRTDIFQLSQSSLLHFNKPTRGEFMGQEEELNALYWAKRDLGSDTGQGNAYIGSAVRKPNGKESKLFGAPVNSGDRGAQTLIRFDVWSVKNILNDGKDVYFQLFTDDEYKEVRKTLEFYTNLWNKKLGEGRRFREGTWTEPEPMSPAASVDLSTAESREIDARAAAEKLTRPEIGVIEKRQLKQLNIPNVLLSQATTIAEATGVTTGKRKLQNISSYKGSPESLVGILGSQGKDIQPFVEATPDQLGALSPHIQLFFSQRNADGSETDEPVFFSDHVNPDHLLEVANARRTDDLSKLQSTKGSNVGIRSFEWVYDNKHFGDNVLIANLSIYFASMADLVQPQWHELLGLTGDIVTRNTVSTKPTQPNELITRENEAAELKRLKNKVKYRKKILSTAKKAFSRDTMNAEAKKAGDKSKSGIGKEYRDLKIIIGWSTPETTYGRADAKFIKSIRATQKLIKLNLMKFQIDFGQEGQATLNMEFAGSIGNFLSDDQKADVLGLTQIEEHYDTTPVEMPLLLPGDRLLGLPETTMPKGYLSTIVKLSPDRINIDYYKKLGTAGNLGSLGGKTIEVNRAGIKYELKTLMMEKQILLGKGLKTADGSRTAAASKALDKLNTYITTANSALESIDNLFRKAKYASFLQRMFEDKKIYYSALAIAQTRDGPEVRFYPRGNAPLDTQTEAATKNLQKSWVDTMDRAEGVAPAVNLEQDQDLSGGFIDPAAPILSDISIEQPGQVNAYYMKLGDIIDTAFATAKQRNDCGVILGSFSPSGLGIGNATSPRYYSLADIPISLEAYGDWFNTHITNRGLARISFRRFVVSLLDDLVGPMMNNLLNQAAKRLSMKFEITVAQSEGQLKKGVLYSEAQMRTRLSGIIPEQNRKINQYFVITCNQVSGDLRGNIEEDVKRGIQHLVIGSDRGLVKSFTFSEKQIPHLRAMNIANANWGEALILPQDAELTMYGNNLFQNGQMVYINADLGLGTTVARRLGLGGYYRVVKSSHSITPGSYETIITCHWEMPPV